MNDDARAIAERLAVVRDRIDAAAKRAGRDASAITLLAVSKTFPVSAVVAAAEAGLRHFGENRVQEASRKVPRVREASAAALEFHLIGSLQRNKSGRAAEIFDVIQTVDRVALARSLDRAAAERGRRPRVYVQVNLDAEPQKGGVEVSEAARLVEEVAALPSLELVGLMAIPAEQPNPEISRRAFARLRSLQERLKLNAPGLTELSMGMSSDFEVAVEEGATCVRVGTALFGPRAQPAPNPGAQHD